MNWKPWAGGGARDGQQPEKQPLTKPKPAPRAPVPHLDWDRVPAKQIESDKDISRRREI